MISVTEEEIKSRLISREHFIELVDRIEELVKLDRTIFDISHKVLEFPPELNIEVDKMQVLLRIIMQDSTDLIGYYMWEINFGEDYKPGCITFNDEEIDISDSGKLYDILYKEMNTNGCSNHK